MVGWGKLADPDSATAMGLVAVAPGWDGGQKRYRAGVMPPCLLAGGSLLAGCWVWASLGSRRQVLEGFEDETRFPCAVLTERATSPL